MTSPSEPQVPGVDTQWLVHCSPERTLIARRTGEDTVLVKLFERGSLLDAQQEAEFAGALTHPQVVAYRSAGEDPVTRKPCVVMDYWEGDNLERLVADRGPLAPIAAAGIAGQIAAILANFHDTPRPGAALGYVHGDIKPANLQRTRDPDGAPRIVVLDLEHVVAWDGSPATATSDESFTGGTHGYAPPESYRGEAPTPAFDVFALGATLFFLLTGAPAFSSRDPEAAIEAVRAGRPRLRLLGGLPQPLVDQVVACLDPDPTRRPTAAAVATRLEAFVTEATPDDREFDRVLGLIQAGEDVDAPPGVETLAATRRRLWKRLGGPPKVDVPDLDGEADLVAASGVIADWLPRLTTFLSRFPQHRPSLEARQQLAKVGQELLHRVPPRVATLNKEARFVAAGELLSAALDAATAIHNLPGGLSLATMNTGQLPGPILRNPTVLLQRAQRDVDNQAQVHSRLVERIEAAETVLDLDGARAAVDELTAIYGGASVVAAPWKDRLLRLEFYLQRIAAPKQQPRQLEDILDLADLPHRLEITTSFRTLCGERAIHAASTPRGKGGIRALLDTMHQLVDDFPHAAATVIDAESALADAMRRLTNLAWEGLDDANRKLDAVPIPVRPVQKLLNRLDAMRMLEAFVDLPQGSRERLQDEIDRVRMRLDQARTTRDNIARGAEAAMERGHLTTALFDMARAVDRFEDEDSDGDLPGEGESSVALTDRLEEARRRKQALEQRIVENQRLATRYMSLLDSDTSTATERLTTLEDRARVLDQLIRVLGPDKGEHYVTDLGGVMVQLINEKVDQGERLLSRALSPEARMAAVQSTLRSLHETTAHANTPRDVGGHVRRVLDQWHLRDREIQDEIQQAQQAEREGHRRRRRVAWTSSLAVVVLALAAFGTWQAVYAGATAAPTLSYTPVSIRIERNGDKINYARLPAYLALTNFVDRLKAADLQNYERVADLELVARAQILVEHLGKLVDGEMIPDNAWTDAFEDHLTDLDRALAAFDQRIGDGQAWREVFAALRRFGGDAQLVGLSLALVNRPDPAYLAALRAELGSLRHVTISAADAAQLTRVAER